MQRVNWKILEESCSFCNNRGKCLSLQLFFWIYKKLISVIKGIVNHGAAGYQKTIVIEKFLGPSATSN